MSLLQFLLLSLFLSTGPQNAHKPSDKIDEDDLRVYLAKENDCPRDQIYFSTVEQADLLKLGYDQAVVVASTCMTGTAGPDLHAVFTRDGDGEIKELKMQEVKLPHTALFGNSNAELRIRDGVLVEVYHDTSERDDPLIVKFKWNPAKDMFEIVSVEAAPEYKTSYDCAKAEQQGDETALAICHVESLADLDVELAERYKAYLAKLDDQGRKKAVEEQRAWLKERDKSCVVYKMWVDCLEGAYKKRIAELQVEIDNAKMKTTPREKVP
ncbi:MAG: lysozyme inhibitor LprI family protein [Candidatus Acidiferrum sp.]